MAFRTSIPDFQLANPIYAGAAVKFFEADQNGAKTATVATLYAAPTGSATAGNPQVLDSEGKFAAPVYIDRPVIAEVTTFNNESHDTGVIVPLGQWKGDWQTATLYVTGDILVEPGDGVIRRVYAATQVFLSGASIAADIAAGKLALRFEQMAIIAVVTQAEYDAVDPKDDNTLYAIVD